MSSIDQTSTSSSLHPSTSISDNGTEAYNDPILGKVNLYFSLWIGEQKESNRIPKNKFNSTLYDRQSPKFSCIPYDANRLSQNLTSSLNVIRNVIETILCRGTEFEISSSADSKRNICDTLELHHDIQLRASQSSVYQTLSDKVKILSSSVDTIFYLTDKTSEDEPIRWIDFKVSFPVTGVKKEYEEMFGEKIETRSKSNNNTSSITDSLSLIETTANIALGSVIVEGKFDHMLHNHLKRSGYGHVWTIASPEGKEQSLIVNPIRNCSNFVKKEGAYPNPLQHSFFSARQLVGAALLVGIGIFVFFVWTISMSRKFEEKEREKRNDCEKGFLSSHKGLEDFLALKGKGNCLCTEGAVKDCYIDIKDASTGTDETSQKFSDGSFENESEQNK